MKTYAIQQQIAHLVNQALETLESNNPAYRGQRLGEIADSLKRIEKRVRTSQDNVVHFHMAKLKNVPRDQRFRLENAQRSELQALATVERQLQSAWSRILNALLAEAKKSPTDHSGKTATQLLNELASDIQDFAENLSTVEKALERHTSHTTEVVMIRQEISTLRAHKTPGTADLLLILVMVLRLMSLTFKNRRS